MKSESSELSEERTREQRNELQTRKKGREGGREKNGGRDVEYWGVVCKFAKKGKMIGK